MAPFKFTQEQEIEIAKLYRHGSGLQELAVRFSCCMTTIGKAVRRRGMAMRRAGSGNVRFGPVGEVVIAYMYELGYLPREIAELVKCSEQTVRKILVRRGVWRRQTYHQPNYIPTPEEIRLGAARVRENWSDKQRRERAGIRDVPTTVPLVHDLPAVGHCVASES